MMDRSDYPLSGPADLPRQVTRTALIAACSGKKSIDKFTTVPVRVVCGAG